MVSQEPVSLNRQVAVITGGTTGVGRETAHLLAEHGARVLVFGRHEPELSETLQSIRRTGGQAAGLTADITHLADVQRVFSEADRLFGTVDILVNCAALPARSVAETESPEAQYVIQANLNGTVACCRAAAQRMRIKGAGQIVNLGSMAANVHDNGASLYVATKSGIQGLSLALGKELAKWGIRVTLIEPGAIGSGMVTESMERQAEMQDQMVMLKAQDVAACILFCLTRPSGVNIAVLRIKPHRQFI
ncbi:MAG TPA: SDR family oxidoreductase [Anaerolineaceae bacterium]|nr:SDR family oxidoreductase [Anaerolineaceae bacterium]